MTLEMAKVLEGIFLYMGIAAAVASFGLAIIMVAVKVKKEIKVEKMFIALATCVSIAVCSEIMYTLITNTEKFLSE